VDVLLQVEELEQQYQFDKINAVKNRYQVKCKMKKSIETETVDDSFVIVKQKYYEGMKDNPSSRIYQFCRDNGIRQNQRQPGLPW
jgi:hypothetical protein